MFNPGAIVAITNFHRVAALANRRREEQKKEEEKREKEKKAQEQKKNV